MVSESQQASVSETVPSSLEQLQSHLEHKTHLLASDGDEELASAALQVVRDIFDLGLRYEQLSHPHIQPFIISTLEPPAVGTRSKDKAKEKGKGKANGADEVEEEDGAIDPSSVLPYTPLSGLTTEGLDVEQIWAQLELRNEGLVEVIKQVGPIDIDTQDGDSDSGSDEDDDSEGDEDDSMEDMTEEEFREMMMRGDLGDSDEDGEDEEDDEVDFYDDEDGSEGDGEDSVEGTDEDVDLDDDASDDDLESGMEEVTDEENDEEMEGLDEEEGEDEEVDDEDEEDEEEEDGSVLFGDDSGPSQPRSKRQHPTLDDEFFSIDEFNRLTEEAEAARTSSGRLGENDEDDDEELEDDIGDLMLKAGDESNRDAMYSDFFAPPRGSGKGKRKADHATSKSKGKSKGKQRVRFGEMEESDSEEQEETREVMSRFKGDLFDDDEEDQNLSTHEKQQLALAKQIAELEQEAVGPKDWTLLGEATSRARPENSLLEEDLDFEQVAKVTPVVTEEKVLSLEEMIKKRIIENNFDSPVRVRAYEPTPFLPSRYFELQDSQSSKSLAQIYEDEYQAAAAGGKAKDPRDEKLRREHEEIDKLWGDICYKLDALSSLNFVPKQPKAQITTLDNLPTTTMESALPPTSAATTLLAPEELFAPSSSTVARSELTPEQAQAARTKRRKAKKGERRRLEEMAELYGKKAPGGVRAEKERALEGLVKSGKGVTVVGKGARESGGRKRSRDGAERSEDGKRLKL